MEKFLYKLQNFKSVSSINSKLLNTPNLFFMFLLIYPSVKVDYLRSIVLAPLEKQWMQKQDTYSPGDNQKVIPMYKEL